MKRKKHQALERTGTEITGGDQQRHIDIRRHPGILEEFRLLSMVFLMECCVEPDRAHDDGNRAVKCGLSKYEPLIPEPASEPCKLDHHDKRHFRYDLKLDLYSVQGVKGWNNVDTITAQVVLVKHFVL